MFFADDLVLISETPSGLQECLSALEKYCKDWKLTVNSNKSNIITFSKKGKKHDMHKFYYNNNIIVSTKQYKYLGVVFTSNGLLKTGSTQLTERAKQEAQRATYRAPEYNVPPFWRIGQGGHLFFFN